MSLVLSQQGNPLDQLESANWRIHLKVMSLLTKAQNTMSLIDSLIYNINIIQIGYTPQNSCSFATKENSSSSLAKDYKLNHR